MKDPASSAYSFAYYVDVAGREIDKAKRYGRRFTIATILLEPVMLEGAGRAGADVMSGAARAAAARRIEGPTSADVDAAWGGPLPDSRAAWEPGPPPDSRPGWGEGAVPHSSRRGMRHGGSFAMDPAELADQLLGAARDTDILARVDENEFHLLMPETAGLDAHACYRRILARLAASDRQEGTLPRGLLVGLTTFPHDGQGLAQLLRVARRRAEATKDSIVHRIPADRGGVGELLDRLVEITRGAEQEGEPPPSVPGLLRSSIPARPYPITAPRLIDLALPEAVGLSTSVVRSALRGGAVFVVVAHHPGLSLGAAVRGALGSPREDVVLHALDVRAAPGCEDVEALCVLAEHGAYAFIGRSQGGFVRGIHAADPLLADFLAERLGRAAGLRVFG
jgi:hypothetical protein